jgi:hypothetical protein
MCRIFTSARFAVLAGILLAGNVLAQVPSGTLDIRGTIQITQGGSGETITLTDTNYSWFSGDRIRVTDGYGILYLNEGNSFGFLTGTDATLSIDNGTITADLPEGDLIYALQGEDRELFVNSSEFTFEARPAEDLAPCLGLTAAGLVQAPSPARNRVTVQSGELEGFNGSRTVERLVEPGEQYEFTPQAARRIEIDLPPEVEDQLDTERSALPCMVWWLRQEAAGPVIAGAGASAGTIGIGIVGGATAASVGSRIIGDDDDDDPDPDPVSP